MMTWGGPAATDGAGGYVVPVRRVGQFPLSGGRLLWLSMRLLVERWAGLLVPIVLASLALLAGLVVLVAPLASDRLHVTGYRFGLEAPPDRPLLIAFACWLVLVVVASAYVAAVQVLLVRSALDAQPMPVRKALAAAPRSVPAVSLLLALVCALATLVAAGAAMVAGWLEVWVWVPAVLFGLLGWWLAVRLFVAVPAVVAGGRGPVHGIRVAHGVLQQRWFPYAGSVLFVVAGVLVGVAWLAEWLLAPVEEAAGLATGALFSIPSLLVCPIWVCLATVVLVNPREMIKDACPPAPVGPPSLRRRALPLVLAALVLPGLLLTGMGRLNPTDLPTTASIDAGIVAGGGDVPIATVRLGAGRTATVFQGSEGFEVAFCNRTTCPPEQAHKYEFPGQRQHPIPVAAMGDGSIVLAAWIPDGDSDT